MFGALGEFERDLIRDRTKAGLAAAAARGRIGGRKPVVNDEKLQRAREYMAKGLNVREAAARLKIGKTALYVALQASRSGPFEAEADAEKIATIRLTLCIENNSKFVRGKKRARQDAERYCLEEYDAKQLPSGEYELKVPYSTATMKTSTNGCMSC